MAGISYFVGNAAKFSMDLGLLYYSRCLMKNLRQPGIIPMRYLLIENRKVQSSFLKWQNIRSTTLSRLGTLFRSNLGNSGCLKSKRLQYTMGCFAIFGGKAFCSRYHIYCEASIEKTAVIEHDRLEGITVNDGTQEPHFDWSQFWKLLKPQIHHFVAAVLSALVVALANVYIPTMLGDVVNIVAKFTQGSLNDGSTFLSEILEPSIKIFKIYVIQAAFTFLYIAFLTKMGEGIASDLRQQLFNALLKQDVAFYDEHKTGELINRLTADVQDFKSSFKMVISQGMRSITQIIGCGASMFAISPQMAGITAVVVPTIIVVGTALGSLLRSLSRAAQHQVGIATGVADECLGNIRTVRAFAMEEQEIKLFAREIEKSRHLNEMLGIGIGVFQSGANMFLNGVILGTLYAGGSFLSSGHLQPGDLMTFLVSAQTIQRSLAQLSVLLGTYVRGVSAGGRVFEYINSKPKISLQGGNIIPYHSLIGTVEFKNVSFSYPTRSNQLVLQNFSLTVPSGKVVAIVGASGGGKSTLAQLLERFYDVSEGSICIDGRDIRELNPSWLRGKALGFINQEPVLFATSVLENIRYGRPDASDKEVIEAAKTAFADDFITGFPNGYNTIVGERGVAVSGGQKQRIAIARAILKNPSILILDEATSALDAESEAVVQKALEKCSEGRTVIVIAHRLSTIQNADVIAVMSRGKLAELGTHEELKKLGGIYAELIKLQQREEITSSKDKRSWGFL